MKTIFFIILTVYLLMLAPTSFAEEYIPKRVASLKSDTVNVRAGPGTQYPILWIFKHKSWPVRIISEYQSWYKITDTEGETGWIYKSLISNTHTVAVSQGQPTLMYRDSEMTKPMFKLSENVVLKLNKCTPYLCQVVYNKRTGWVSKNRLLMVE